MSDEICEISKRVYKAVCNAQRSFRTCKSKTVEGLILEHPNEQYRELGREGMFHPVNRGRSVLMNRRQFFENLFFEGDRLCLSNSQH